LGFLSWILFHVHPVKPCGHERGLGGPGALGALLCGVLFGCFAASLAAQTTEPAPTTKPTRSLADSLQHIGGKQLHILYLHGIASDGPGDYDSWLLRKNICDFLKDCTAPAGELYGNPEYADQDEFELNAPPPSLKYLGSAVWRTDPSGLTSQEWNAAAPFVVHWKLARSASPAIFVDEINWWPLLFSLKCRQIVRSDASLVGPSADRIKLCSTRKPDSRVPGRFISYDWIEAPEAHALMAHKSRGALVNPAVRAAQLKLDEMVEEFQFEGVLCEPIALTGDPAKQISLLAKARAVDRVILGARSASRMTCRVEGSLAEEVIATVDVPVCIIGRHAGPGPAHGGPLSRVLCATKLNSGSLQTVRFAGALAEWNHAHLTLLHVLDTEGMSEQSLPLARFAAREKLCASVPAEATHRDHPSFLIREGDPASLILSEALSRSEDLVILGYHPIPMVPRLFTNRVIRLIIDESQCPVIIINSGQDVSAPEIHESIRPEKMLVHE
jgi:nucleotide-binding universal stress UspA family protein